MKKWIEVVLGIILGLLLIFRGVELWFGYKLKKAAATELHEMSDGVYHLDIGRLSVGFFDRSMKIKNVSITTDSVRLTLLASNGGATHNGQNGKPYPAIKISIAELFVKGIGFTLRDKTTAALPDTSTFENGVHSALMRSFEKLTANRIRMRGVDGECDIFKDDDTVRYKIRRTTIEADDYDLNSDTYASPLHFSDVRLTVRKFERKYRHETMTLTADTLTVSTKTGSVALNHMNIKPRYAKTEYAIKTPGHPDWSFFDLREIRIWGMDFSELSTGKRMIADSLSIARLDAGSYKNRNIHRDEWKRYMFYESLHKLPFEVGIGKIELLDGNAFYEELAEGSDISGTVRFSELGAVATNVSNMAASSDDRILLEAWGKLMDSGELRFKMSAPADSTKSRFEIDGTLGSMDLAVMNPVLEPLAQVRIDSGRLNSLDFRVTGNAHKSSVSTTMLYDGLTIMVLEEENDGEERERKFLSSLINGIIVRESNPDALGTLHKGNGSFTRDTYKSQFNYLWKSIAPSILNSVGVPNALIKQHTHEQDHN